MGLFRWRGRPRAEVISTSEDLAKVLRGVNDEAAGIAVDAISALTFSAVFACVRNISEDVGKIPLILYERQGDGKRRATDHPLYPLFHDRMNPWQTSGEFREMMTAHVLLRGNAFGFKNRLRGELREIIPLLPDDVTVDQDDNLNVIYKVNEQGTEQEYRSDRIFHVKGLSSNGFEGISVVGSAREAISLGLATERHGAKMFSRGAKPGAVLQHPNVLSEEAQKRLGDSIDTNYSGDNAWRTLVLEEGMTWQQTGMTNEDAQFLESRKFQAEEIARWFRIPPHKIGILDNTPRANIEQSAIEYVVDTLMPWLVRWERLINTTILEGDDDLFVEFLIDGLLRGDTQSRFEAYNLAINGGGHGGWMTPNEARTRENLNPIDGLDDVFRPSVELTPPAAVGDTTG